MSSLDKEAMQHIEGLSKAGQRVVEADFAALYVPEGMKIQGIEEFQEFKNRFTGGFMTDSLDSFAQYVNDQKEKVCFVHSKRPVAVAIFDLGTEDEPLHAKHRAVFEVDDTAAYAAVKSFAQGRHSQEEMAEFMEDWMFCIQCLDADGEEIAVRSAISAVRRVTIEAAVTYQSEVQQLSTTKSSLESIEAKCSNYPLPAWINFSCEPYKCIENTTFPIRVSMSVKPDAIKFIPKISNLEKIQEDISESFAEKVTDSIGTEAKSYLGQFSIDGRGEYR